MAIVFKSFFFLINKTSNTTKSWQKGTEMRTYCCWDVRWCSQHSGNTHTDDLKTQHPQSRPLIPETRTRVHTKLGHNTCSHKPWTQMYTEGLLIRAPKLETSKMFLSFRTVNKLWQQVHGKLLLLLRRFSRVRPSATP